MNMSSKHIILRIFLLAILFRSITHTQAFNENDHDIPDYLASFTLENLQNHEDSLVYSDVTDHIVITVKLDSENNYNATPAQIVQNKTYIITYKSLTEHISYKIDIMNYKITSAHSGSYSVFGYSVKSSKLRRINSKSVSYDLECSSILRSWTNRLQSKIDSNNKLVISFSS